MRWLVSFVMVIVLVSFVAAAPHSQFPVFSAPEGFSVDNNVVSVGDDAIYQLGWYSIAGADWQSFSLSGDSYGDYTNWLTSGSYTLPSFGVGEHYVIVYSCSNPESWDCHGGWQLEIINNTEIVDNTNPNQNVTHYLVENGVALADIVISSTPLRSAVMAVNYFQKYLHDMTGVNLSIGDSPDESYDFHVYIGESSYTDSLGVTSEGCENGGFKMISGEDSNGKGYLILLGDDKHCNPIRHTEEEWDAITGYTWKNSYWMIYNYQYDIYKDDGRGSINAVYEFMYDQGLRWYYPSEIGKITPEKTEIKFQQVNKLVNPDFAKRELFLYYMGLKYNSIAHYPETFYEQMEWFFNLRINTMERYPLAHGVNDVTNREESIATHPEYWEMNSTGVRVLPGMVAYPNQDLCSEELKQENILFVKAMVDTYGVNYVSVAPADGFTSVSYSSPECAAMKDETRDYNGMLSNYVWNYVNDVAWAIYEEYGDEVKIACGAYTTYQLPPDDIKDPRGLAPNIIVSVARSRSSYADEETKQYYNNLIDEWVSILPSKKVSIADYYLQNWPGSDTQAVPFYHPHIISEDLKFLKGKSIGEFTEVFANTYVEGGVYDMEWDTFIASSLNVYVISRLWWDADQDVDEILEEYYDLYYGPAREEMKALVEYSEQNAYLSTTKPTVIATIQDLADEALLAAQQDSDPIYAQRVNEVVKLVYSDYGGDEMEISSCQDLDNINMVYRLTSDVSSPGTCFNIDADGVTLDCQGHTITYSTDGGEEDYAIYNQEFFTYRGDYFIIRNCVIEDGSYLTGAETGAAIRLANADFGIVEDTVINVSGTGIYSGSSVFNKFLRNTITSYSGNAFSGTISPSYEIGYWTWFENNTFSSYEGNGLSLYYLDNVTLINNIFESATKSGFSTYQVTNITSINNTLING